MLSLTSVTVCAMALAFAVVFCAPPDDGCPLGYAAQCINPEKSCPKGPYPSHDACPQMYFCCEDGVCACTGNIEKCSSETPPKCQKCCVSVTPA